MMGRAWLISAFPLWMNLGSAAALVEPEICYVLDGILFLYGIILTALYCRLRMNAMKQQPTAPKQESIYIELDPRAQQDTYEEIGQRKGLH
ncbi:high affinity immunoglobulin epsilon receptor subunit gamma-like [Osmerus mordax]|uniref:high affinity immunoglobulin epsilon receptor subunit gamma-like n=1 Tax=Osmerus mordax TaxID=8014 RepID=UPI0001989B4C|nr:High affinity immunoglobulin epsilon receptor gamma-subunit precursor [Osmerus mordax]